jgi:hypothetical protein
VGKEGNPTAETVGIKNISINMFSIILTTMGGIGKSHRPKKLFALFRIHSVRESHVLDANDRVTINNY